MIKPEGVDIKSQQKHDGMDESRQRKQGGRVQDTYTEDLDTWDGNDDYTDISHGSCDSFDTAVLPKRC
jgi:hypothetical protein